MTIGRALKRLRLERRWTQSELAEELGMSQARVSHVERGSASLSAEEFVHALRVFRVDVAAFVGETTTEPDAELRSALYMLGAKHLAPSTTASVPERLGNAKQVVVASLLSRDPRLVASLAPVLVRALGSSGSFDFVEAYDALERLGIGTRLGWLVENVVTAIRTYEESGAEPSVRTRKLLARARLELEMGHDYLVRVAGERPRSTAREDLFDSTVRTSSGLERIRGRSSPISRRWRIVTELGPEDFLRALSDGLAAH